MFEGLESFITETISMPTNSLNKTLLSIAVVVVAWALTSILGFVVTRLFGNVERKHALKKLVGRIILLAAIILLGRIWLTGLKSLSTFLGLLSAGLAIALKDPLSNLVAWAVLVARKPFKIGDRIEIGPHIGDVIDVNPFQFTMIEVGKWVDAEQSTGRMIHVPNGKIFEWPLVNFYDAFNYNWHEIPVLVTFESDWRKAKKILELIVSKHAGGDQNDITREIQRGQNKYLVKYSQTGPKIYTRVDSDGILLTLRFLCRPRAKRTSEEHLWENILEAFEKEKTISFAYKTTRIITNSEKDKSV
jgi:small-conductance mechanosensitive channel